jgi:hypothetical protein
MFGMGFRSSVESWGLGQTDPKLVAVLNAARVELAEIRSWQASLMATDSSILSVVDDGRFRELDRIVTMDNAAVNYLYEKTSSGELLELEQANDAREWAAQVHEMYQIMIRATGKTPTKLETIQVQAPNGNWYTAPATPVKAPSPVPAAPTATLPSKASPFTAKNLLVGGGVAAGVGIILYALWG